jgi:hypothetical protein
MARCTRHVPGPDRWIASRSRSESGRRRRWWWQGGTAADAILYAARADAEHARRRRRRLQPESVEGGSPSPGHGCTRPQRRRRPQPTPTGEHLAPIPPFPDKSEANDPKIRSRRRWCRDCGKLVAVRHQHVARYYRRASALTRQKSEAPTRHKVRSDCRQQCESGTQGIHYGLAVGSGDEPCSGPGEGCEDGEQVRTLLAKPGAPALDALARGGGLTPLMDAARVGQRIRIIQTTQRARPLSIARVRTQVVSLNSEHTRPLTYPHRK